MAFIFEMPHILMSIIEKENTCIATLILYSTFQVLWNVTHIYHNLIPYYGRLYINVLAIYVIRKIDLLLFIMIKYATSYVSRMQKNVILFLSSW